MKYLEDSRLAQLTSDLTGAFLNTRGSRSPSGSTPTRPAGGGHRGRGRRNKSSQPSPNAKSSYYAYNPEGYSTYNENGASPSAGSSSRAIYGRVEAYTTKRAGSDKKTAHEVGERYATEMERLNEAVEALKRRKKRYGQQAEREEGIKDLEKKGGEKAENVDRRPRSRSVDGVTFATAASRTIVFDGGAEPAVTPLEDSVIDVTHAAEALQEASNKRNLPLEGILKRPSSPTNKRMRATSFDVSTGPSNFDGASRSRFYRDHGQNHVLSLSTVQPTIEEEQKTHPLIPQPSLYRSSIGSEPVLETNGGSPAVAPRRLVTDLILTLNASFPDYDFGDARVSDFRTLPAADAVRRVNERLGEFAATTDAGRDFLPRFWASVEDVLFGDLRGCEVYSYAPREGRSGDDDPLEFLTRSMAGGDDEAIGRGRGEEAGKVLGGGLSFSLAEGGRIVSDDVHQVSPLSLGSCPPHVTLWSMNYFFVSRNKKRIVFFACVQTVRTPQGSADDYDDYHLGRDEHSGYGENNLVFDEARREKENGEHEDALSPLLSSASKKMIGSSAIRDDYKVSEMDASRTGDESASVMVEDTDIEEGVDFEDVDGDEAHVHNDFDTGTLSVPSQVV